MKKRHYGLALVFTSILLLTACSEKGGNNNSVNLNDTNSALTFDSISSEKSDISPISEQDIESAIKSVKQSGIDKIESNENRSLSIEEMNTYVKNTSVYDLNFDGKDEILVVDSYSVPEVHVFEKSNGNIEESSVFKMQALMYMNNKLELQPYENGDEKYYYFTFREGEGVMKATVLGAVKQSGNGYDVQYLYSYGTLEYNDISEPVKKEFYRKGWDKYDIALEESNPNDISKEELDEILKNYNIVIE